MPIAEYFESQIPEQASPTISDTQPTYQGVTVDSKFIDLSKLIVHMEGSPWRVYYYSQILNRDNTPVAHDVHLHPVFQQYKLIENFELRVSSPLTQTQDSSTKEFTVVGTSNVYPFLIPNEGDVFIADVGDGREAVFKVTMSEQKSIFKNTAYQIEYTLVDYLTPERRSDLDSKVIERFAFDKSFLTYGQTPLVEKKEYTHVRSLEAFYASIAEIYTRSFLNKEYKVFLVPGQPITIYDHFLARTLFELISGWDTHEFRDLKLLNCDDDNNLKTLQIWDVLLKNDPSLLNYAATRVGLVSTKSFTSDPMLEGIYHSRIRQVVYPIDPVVETDYAVVPKVKSFTLDKIRHVPPRTLAPTAPTQVPNVVTPDFDTSLVEQYVEIRDNIEIPDGSLEQTTQFEDSVFQDTVTPLPEMVVIRDVPLVTDDDYYVFSKNFYNYTSTGQNLGLSRLEMEVWKMLKGGSVDREELIYFCETYHQWGAVERFYYLPVLMILIKHSIYNL